jgi:hypothetical protein
MPFLIGEGWHMDYIGAHEGEWDKHFRLVADLNLGDYAGTSFHIIGNQYHSFNGTFDGNDHTISNFTYDSTGTDYVAVFGHVSGGGAEIKNLRLINPHADAGTGRYVGSLVGRLGTGVIANCRIENATVVGSNTVGGLVGYNVDGEIADCCVEGGSVAGGGNYTGGLVGFNSGQIYNSHAMASVSGDSWVGGLAGISYDDLASTGFISECHSTGLVSGNNLVGGLVGYNLGGILRSYAIGDVLGAGGGPHDLGGLVGRNDGYTARISNCYATGDIAGGSTNVGGLVGTNVGAPIHYCYSKGSVTGSSNIGGLVGENTGHGRVRHCFWDVETSGWRTSDGGKGRTTAKMMTESTFTSAGWDFDTPIWTICSYGGNYPRLWWAGPMVYHVNVADGDDENNGLAPRMAFATIQAGIDATSYGCEKVLVWPGIYSEDFSFDGKAITVEGQADVNGVPIIEAPGASFYSNEGPNSVLQYFVIRNCDTGILVSDAFPTLRNLTIVDNSWGLAAYLGAEPNISNCIFWDNADGDLYYELTYWEPRYSCIQRSAPGQGNIAEDPCFVDANNGDYHLKSQGWRWAGSGSSWTWDEVTSPCIDAGNPGTPLGNEPMSIPPDPNNVRGVNIRVNMGAYGGTSQASIGPHGWALLADLNNDGIVDWLDAGLWVQYWLSAGSELPGDLDRNGAVDAFDYVLFGRDWSQETVWR